MFFAAFSAGFIGKRTSDSPAEVESVLWQAVLLGLVASRTAFVLEYLGSYSAAPLSIFDIRDGGWRPVAGFAAAWLFIAWRQFKLQRLRKPLMWAALTGTVIWGSGLLALALPQQEQQKVPSMALVGLDGSRVDLAQFRGKPMVVNLWATWCPPLRAGDACASRGAGGQPQGELRVHKSGRNLSTGRELAVNSQPSTQKCAAGLKRRGACGIQAAWAPHDSVLQCGRSSRGCSHWRTIESHLGGRTQRNRR